MKPEILALCTDRIQRDAAERFALDPESLTMLDGFENVVLEASKDGRQYILRLSHSTHRNADLVHAELDWLDYLARDGVSVCTPLRSRSGALIETLEAQDGGFVAVVFEKAPGGHVERAKWTPRMAYNRGKLLGRMHTLTKDYRPPSEQVKRRVWYDDDDFVNYRSYLPDSDSVVGDRLAEIIAELKSLATDRDSFGLIHMDAHTGNIFFDGDRPILFDFDDCGYDFFVSDIAISLYYAIPRDGSEVDRREFSRAFLHSFLEGYRTENRLDNRWREVLPLILRRREALLYAVIYRGFDSNDFDEWCRNFLTTRRPRIADRLPLVDLNWSEFDLGG